MAVALTPIPSSPGYVGTFDAPGIAILDNMPILPRHKLGAALKGGTFAKAWGLSTPPADLAGLGPFMLEEYLGLLAEAGINMPYAPQARGVLLHGHCHQKAMVGTGPSLAALRAVPGFAVTEVDSGCCGMAGSFGVEREHYAISIAMGERALFKVVREQPSNALIVAAGASCRQQIAHGMGRVAVHLAEALAGALDAPGG